MMGLLLHKRVKVPSLIGLGAALATVWLSGEAWQAIHSGPGLAVPCLGILVAGALVLESLRELDSTSPAFQTFMVVLSALVLPIILAGVLLILNAMIDPGSDAPFVAFVLWWPLHLPFLVFLPRGAGFQIVFLSIVQWTTIGAIAARLTRDWRAYEAIALTVATILIVGIVSVAGLLLLGYRLPFEGI